MHMAVLFAEEEKEEEEPPLPSSADELLREWADGVWSSLLHSYDASLSKIWAQAGKVRVCQSVEARLLGELKAEVDGALGAGTRELRALAPWVREILPSMTGATSEELGQHAFAALQEEEAGGWPIRHHPPRCLGGEIGNKTREEVAGAEALLALLPSAWGLISQVAPEQLPMVALRLAMRGVIETVLKFWEAVVHSQGADATRDAARRCRVVVRAFAGLQAHWKRFRHRGTAPWLSLAARKKGTGRRQRSRSLNRQVR